jgi:hypothetical protein
MKRMLQERLIRSLPLTHPLGLPVYPTAPRHVVFSLGINPRITRHVRHSDGLVPWRGGQAADETDEASPHVIR